MKKIDEQRLITKQLATVRMLRTENERIIQGKLPRVDYNDWSEWLDISIDDILELQEYCQSLDHFELCTNVIAGIGLDGIERKCALTYINTYGRVICRMANSLVEEKTNDFILNSINAFTNRFVKTEQIETDITVLKKGIYSAAINYLTQLTGVIEEILNKKYSIEIAQEMCCF